MIQDGGLGSNPRARILPNPVILSNPSGSFRSSCLRAHWNRFAFLRPPRFHRRMGFFDRFSKQKPEPAPHTNGSTEPAPVVKGAKPLLVAAREKLEAKDLPGAVAIYDEVLKGPTGDRADVLVAISGDLGTHGHVAEIIELIAPRYDAERHGPAIGLNLIQAYLAVQNPDAAQHVLDILFGLNRPELEERLHGFSNAIAELMLAPAPSPQPVGDAPGGGMKIGLVTLTKPIWFYGLEPLAAQILPPKDGRTRRIAFAQLALPGFPKAVEAARKPEEELGRLSRALPLWLAETFYFSALYTPIAAVGTLSQPPADNQYVIFDQEWRTEHLRQLVDTTEGGLDYIVTGSLRMRDADYEVLLRIWEVKGYRERKTFSVRWTPASADTALLELHGQLRTYLEWSPASAAFAYIIPTKPRGWLETLGASLGLFLVDKGVVPPAQIPPVSADLQRAADAAAGGEAASFAYLTLRQRAARLGLGEGPADVKLARSTLVTQAGQAVR
jgi:hypothetical protein